jgi:ABC-type uncharacterized transport system auxiliary subunit
VKRMALPLLIALLTACAGSLFKNKTAPPTMYMLSATPKSLPADSATIPVAPTGLAVLKLRVRAGLDTDRIAALYPDRRMDYFAAVRWSGPLDEVLQDLAVQELRSNPGLRNVSADASVFASTYWLEIEVTDFQAEYSANLAVPTVHVHFLARLGGSANRHVLGRFEPDIHEVAADNRMTAIVDAYNRAADKAFAEIAVGAALTLSAARSLSEHSP